MVFEWDDEKEKINIQKHGIDFRTASRVFFDESRIESYDEELSISEDRYIVIGKVQEVLFVVYTERKENIRLISARLATAHERRLYYDSDIFPFQGR